MKNMAFSLIELMVVIAIVAILAVMALPSYRTHTIKSQIISVMPVLESFAAQLRAGYNKNGVFPPSYAINGVNMVATSAWTYVNYGKIFGAAYQIASDGKGAAMMFSISGLQGIPNYVEPSQPNNYGMRSNIYYVIRDVDGVLVTACGTYNSGNTLDIPLEYLPAACRCINAGLNFVNGNAC